MKTEYLEKKGEYFNEKEKTIEHISSIDNQINEKKILHLHLQTEIKQIRKQIAPIDLEVHEKQTELIYRQFVLKQLQENVKTETIELDYEKKRVKKLQTRNTVERQEKSTYLEKITMEREKVENDLKKILKEKYILEKQKRRLKREESEMKSMKEETERRHVSYSRELKRYDEKEIELQRENQRFEEEKQEISFQLNSLVTDGQTKNRVQTSELFSMVQKTEDLEKISTDLISFQSEKMRELLKLAKLHENKLDRCMGDIY